LAGGLRKPLNHHQRNAFGAVYISYTGDDLAGHYSKMADDSSQGGAKRTAAMLFAATESQLADGGQTDHEEVLRQTARASWSRRTSSRQTASGTRWARRGSRSSTTR